MTGGVGLGEGRVKFPLCTWKLGEAATQPLACLLGIGQGPIHSTDAALQLSSRWSHCCCEDHFASDSPDSLAGDQVRGTERDGKRLGKTSWPWRHITISLDFEIRSQRWDFYRRTSTMYISLTLNQCLLWLYLFRAVLALSSILLFLPSLHSAQITGWHPVYAEF